MKISLILAHPNPGSFNHAIAAQAVRALRELGHDVMLHDLHAEGFDPIMTKEETARDASLPPLVERHCREIARADGIVIVHPNWWGQPPAILKGWIDRVIRPGLAYRFARGDQGEGVPVGLLRARAALVFNTANTPEPRERTVFQDPLETIWKNCVFGLCGVPVFDRKMFRVVVTSTPEQRQAWLDEVARTVRDHFPRQG